MKVVCHTSLDLRNEQWPDDLPAIPAVGTTIESKTLHQGKFRLELEVCSITYKHHNYDDGVNVRSYWLPHIELHMTSWQKMLYSKKPEACQGSITAFYEWYAPLVGTSVSAFI